MDDCYCTGISDESDYLFQMLKELRGPDNVGPAPGFYGRVLDRIASERSEWDALIYSPMGNRLLVACVTLLLAGAIFLADMAPGNTGAPPSAPELRNAALFSRNPEQQRNAVIAEILLK